MLLRTLVLFLAATVACALALPSMAQGAGRYVEVEYPPSAAPGELQVGVTYILWIPEGVIRLRGVIVHQHGPGRAGTRPSTAPPRRTISTGRRWRKNGIARCSARRITC